MVVIPATGGVYELDGLFVEPSHMYRGVGRALIDDAVESARENGAECLTVTAGPAQGFDEKVGFSGELLGRSTLPVGGSTMTVEHTRLVLTYNGSESGTNPTDFWVVPSTGLIVREKEEVGITSGGVRYSENMEATLVGLTPAH